MHFNLSEFSAIGIRSIQNFGFVKLVIFMLLSFHIVEAKDYCSYCKHHVACNNDGVCFLFTAISDLVLRLRLFYVQIVFNNNNQYKE